MQKARLLYDAIEASNGFFSSPVDPAVRSFMNVPFTIPSKPDLEAVFIKEAAAKGMVGARLLRIASKPRGGGGGGQQVLSQGSLGFCGLRVS